MAMLIAPLEALTDPTLTDSERRVLLTLFSFRGRDTNTVWPGLAVIAERANIADAPRVSKLTTSLAKKGWLTKKKRGFTGCNSYTLTVPDRLTNLANSDKLVKTDKLEDSATLENSDKSNLANSDKSNLANSDKYKEQTIEQTIEHKNTSPEPEALDDPVAISIPTNRYNTESEEFHVRQSLVTEMAELYPGVDMAQEYRAMRAWALSNQTKRKTLRGMPKFINAWLAKAQNEGRNHATDRLGRGAAPHGRKQTPAERCAAKREQLATKPPDLGAVATHVGDVRPCLGKSTG